MVALEHLVAYLDNFLQAEQFKDYCPNGLQVSGKTGINKLVTGVSANQALIEAAVAVHADAILVHHGFFWKNEPTTLTGLRYHRIKPLIKNDISLLAYHLPLDCHPVYGNNVQLAKLLGINAVSSFAVEPGLYLGYQGRFSRPCSGDQLSAVITDNWVRSPLYVPGKSAVIDTIAWCTGAAQDYILSAYELGVDAFLTGEASERTFHLAQETGLHFFAAGHHATERYGVLALGEHLRAQFGLEHEFIDIHNPI